MRWKDNKKKESDEAFRFTFLDSPLKSEIVKVKFLEHKGDKMKSGLFTMNEDKV